MMWVVVSALVALTVYARSANIVLAILSGIVAFLFMPIVAPAYTKVAKFFVWPFYKES